MIKLIYQKENPLLNRKRVAFEVDHSKKETPSRIDLKKKIAENLKVDKSLISIRHVYTKYGKDSSKVIVHVYETEKDLNSLEEVRRTKRKEDKLAAESKKEEPKEEPKGE